MDFALNKLVALEDEEEYYNWLLERQTTGIVILGITNVLMLGSYIGSWLINILFGGYTSYAVYAAGGSLLVAIVADVITIIGFDDLDEWAEISWYLQLAQISLTIVVGLFGVVVLLWNSGWALGSIFGGVSLILNLLLLVGAIFGIAGGVIGGLLNLATLGIWNYNEYGVEGDFDGEEISDEISLSISY